MSSVPSIGCGYEAERQRYKDFLGQDIIRRSGNEEWMRTAPLFSLAVKYKVDQPYIGGEAMHSLGVESDSSEDALNDGGKDICGDEADRSNGSLATSDAASLQLDSLFPQYGLLGFSVRDNDGIGHHEPTMFNMHALNSIFICGSQGSGKSYTLACLLETCLLSGTRFGHVQQPVAGLAFNYDTDVSGAIAETVHLCSRGIKVNVFVSSSNFGVNSERYRVATQGSSYVKIKTKSSCCHPVTSVSSVCID
jgi:hypothetical protein